MRISTEERLGFNRRTFQVPNLMHKLLSFIFTDKHMQRENESAVERFYHVGRPK